MEAKAKAGAPAPKAASKADKKEPAAPRKADHAPAAPAAPAAPEPEDSRVSSVQDGAAEAESAAGDKASATDSMEHLKPFLIGGAIIAAGAILLGVLLLARRN